MNKVIIVLFLILSTFCIAQVELDKGLVGWYSFDEVTDDSIVVNLATAENKAPDGVVKPDSITEETPELVEGIAGNGFWFTPTNFAHVNLGTYDPSADTDELAISCWIYWEGMEGSWQPICGLRNGWEPPTIGWSMVLDSGTGSLQFETNTADGKVFIITPEPPTLEDWTHIVLNFDGAYATYYFDADYVVEGEMVFGEGRSASTFRIGAAWDAGNSFNGTIDEFRIYNRQLTEEEIKFLYDNPGGAVDAVSSDINIPTAYALEQNYPNPFNPSTTIPFVLTRTEHVTLSVYNALGEHVITLVDEIRNAGQYQVLFDSGDLPGGIYFYTLNIGSLFEQTNKMLLLK
jgi:hypothetical protein